VLGLRACAAQRTPLVQFHSRGHAARFASWPQHSAPPGTSLRCRSRHPKHGPPSKLDRLHSGLSPAAARRVSCSVVPWGAVPLSLLAAAGCGPSIINRRATDAGRLDDLLPTAGTLDPRSSRTSCGALPRGVAELPCCCSRSSLSLNALLQGVVPGQGSTRGTPDDTVTPP
jgi:hypothetical protein